MASDLQNAFLSLVRLGIEAENSIVESEFLKSINWNDLQALATEQGLSAIVVDGLERLPVDQKPPKPVLIQWIGEVLQGEVSFAIQQKAAAEMALLFNHNGIRTYVLKGFVVSECYPKPSHRVSADLDCFLTKEHEGVQEHFDAWELGNQLMEEKGFEVDRSFYKNSTINLPGLTVENHQFMNAVRGSKRLKRFEKLLQGHICSDTGGDKFEGTCMCRPPVMVSAMFLIEHAYAHFLHEGLTWRMVLDWMMFSRKHKQQIDWHSLDVIIDKFGFRKFYDTFIKLGQYLFGELPENQLTETDQKMLADVWASLDLHEFHGVKGKMALAGNSIRAAWKYHYFTPDVMICDLFNRVTGFIFERHPKI